MPTFILSCGLTRSEKATVDFDGQHGTATFGVLGYCFNTGGNDNCTSPRVGYEFGSLL